MTKMHENEFEIDEHLVRTLLNSQCPQLPIKAHLQLFCPHDKNRGS